MSFWVWYMAKCLWTPYYRTHIRIFAKFATIVSNGFVQ